MTQFTTGSEVLAFCGSCKMDLAAIVVSKVGAKVAKVQCKTCKKEHGYKAPKGVTEPGAAVPKTPRKKKSSEADAPKTVSVEAEWKRLMGESAKADRVKYSLKANLKLGDIVVHPMFGDGIVMRVLHPDKAEVMFKTDMKLLVHGRR